MYEHIRLERALCCSRTFEKCRSLLQIALKKQTKKKKLNNSVRLLSSHYNFIETCYLCFYFISFIYLILVVKLKSVANFCGIALKCSRYTGYKTLGTRLDTTGTKRIETLPIENNHKIDGFKHDNLLYYIIIK